MCGMVVLWRCVRVCVVLWRYSSGGNTRRERTHGPTSPIQPCDDVALSILSWYACRYTSHTIPQHPIHHTITYACTPTHLHTRTYTHTLCKYAEIHHNTHAYVHTYRVAVVVVDDVHDGASGVV